MPQQQMQPPLLVSMRHLPALPGQLQAARQAPNNLMKAKRRQPTQPGRDRTAWQAPARCQGQTPLHRHPYHNHQILPGQAPHQRMGPSGHASRTTAWKTAETTQRSLSSTAPARQAPRVRDGPVHLRQKAQARPHEQALQQQQEPNASERGLHQNLSHAQPYQTAPCRPGAPPLANTMGRQPRASAATHTGREAETKDRSKAPARTASANVLGS